MQHYYCVTYRQRFLHPGKRIEMSESFPEASLSALQIDPDPGFCIWLSKTDA